MSRLILTTIIAITLGASQATDGCYLISTITSKGKIVVAKEKAIIVWDEKKEQQHFIRMAEFTTVDQSFGFIVPTPTKPDLYEVDVSAFSVLEEMVAPLIIETRYNFACPIGCSSPYSTHPVRLVEQTKVGGYDATILQSSDGKSINDWLAKNNYQSKPEFVKWLDYYAKKNFFITAFKISTNPDEANKAYTAAVRMSFTTKTPFYPYREPLDTPINENRLLRVFFLSNQRYDAFASGKPWKATTTYANSVDSETKKKVGIFLNLEVLPDPLYVTEFEDRSASRADIDDVFFFKSKTNEQLLRPNLHSSNKHGAKFAFLACLGSIALLRLTSFIRHRSL